MKAYADLNNPESEADVFVKVVKFLSEGLICFLNVGGLKYGALDKVLRDSRYKDVDVLEADLNNLVNRAFK